jgi:hypothetical protein
MKSRKQDFQILSKKMCKKEHEHLIDDTTFESFLGLVLTSLSKPFSFGFGGKIWKKPLRVMEPRMRSAREFVSDAPTSKLRSDMALTPSGHSRLSFV